MTRTIRIRVKPGARRGPLVETAEDGVLVVSVRERAVDGADDGGLVGEALVLAKIEIAEDDDHPEVVSEIDDAFHPRDIFR